MLLLWLSHGPSVNSLKEVAGVCVCASVWAVIGIQTDKGEEGWMKGTKEGGNKGGRGGNKGGREYLQYLCVCSPVGIGTEHR